VSGDLNTIEFNVVEANREVGIFIDGYRNDVNHNKLCGNPGTQIVDEGEQTRLGRNQVVKVCPE
jgi:hypothetical protein